MKKNYLFTIIIAVAIIFTIQGFTNKTANTGGIITMRTTEVQNGLWDNSIAIVYEDGKIEKIELKKLKMGDLSYNLTLVNDNLNKIRLKGYKLIGTSGGGGDGIIVTTYTFIKE